MRIHNIAQHLESGEANPDWLALRAGKFSGSDFNQYMAIVDKGKLSDAAETALHKKVLSGIGEVFDSYKSESMERGNELEPLARQAYMCETFADVQEVGFVDWERLRAGCSPDGVIMKPILKRITPRYFSCGGVVGVDDEDVVWQIEKIIEIKCPEIVNYLRYAESARNIPKQYIVQMQYNMLITGAKSCDFVAYYPGMRLIIHTIDADAELQNNIVIALEKLNVRYDEILTQINRLKIGE
jgi:putative phage-type endonuclease